MAEDTKKLLIELILENEDLKIKLNETQKEFQNTSVKSKGFIDSIKQNWLTLTAAVGGFLLSLKSVLKEYAASSRATGDLSQALRNNGEYSKTAMKNFSEFANQMQRTTNTSNNTVMGLLAVGKTMGLTNEQAQEAVKGAIGLSKTFGIDLNNAMRASSAAFEGNTARLVKYIPELANVKGEHQKIKIAVEAMNNGYKIAQNQTEDFQGSTEQLGLQFNNLKETLGKVAATGLGPIIKLITQVLNWFNQLPEPIQKTVGMIAVFAGGVLALSTALKTFGGAMALLNFNPVVLGLTAVVGLVAGFVYTMAKANEYLETNIKLNENYSKGLKKQIDENNERIRQYKELIAENKKQGISTKELEERVNMLLIANQNLNKDFDIQKKHLDELNKSKKQDIQNTNGMSKELKNLMAGYAENNQAMTDNLKLQNEINQLYADSQKSVEMDLFEFRISKIDELLAKKALSLEQEKMLIEAKVNYERLIEEKKNKEIQNQFKSVIDGVASGYANGIAKMIIAGEAFHKTLKDFITDILEGIATIIIKMAIIQGLKTVFPVLSFLSGGGTVKKTADVVYASSGFTPKGRDTVPAMLEEDEEVLPVPVAKAFRNLVGSIASTNGAYRPGGAQINNSKNTNTTNNVQPTINVYSDNPREIVSEINKYLRTYGTSQQGMGL